jgi:hypothetical protein
VRRQRWRKGGAGFQQAHRRAKDELGQQRGLGEAGTWGRLQGRASGRERQHDVHSDGTWFTQGIVSGNESADRRSSAGSALLSWPPTSQDYSRPSPPLSVCATLGCVVYVWRALVHASDRAECADEQGPHQAAESSEATDLEEGRRGFKQAPRHMLKTG